jgi:hypothetical protein
MKFQPDDNDEYNFCNECNKKFEDSFELIDHVLEDDEEFDPYYLLPNGFKLHLGSLLRFFFAYAEDAEQIKMMTQSTYVTLFAAENGYDLMNELVEDMVVKSAMQDLDQNIEKLLSKDTDEEGER